MKNISSLEQKNELSPTINHKELMGPSPIKRKAMTYLSLLMSLLPLFM